LRVRPRRCRCGWRVRSSSRRRQRCPACRFPFRRAAVPPGRPFPLALGALFLSPKAGCFRLAFSLIWSFFSGFLSIYGWFFYEFFKN
jgi:hypothetical protein